MTTREKIEKLSNEARTRAFDLKETIKDLNAIDPVAARDAYVQCLQYFQEAEIRQSFTIGELEQLGYL